MLFNNLGQKSQCGVNITARFHWALRDGSFWYKWLEQNVQSRLLHHKHPGRPVWEETAAGALKTEPGDGCSSDPGRCAEPRCLWLRPQNGPTRGTKKSSRNNMAAAVGPAAKERVDDVGVNLFSLWFLPWWLVDKLLAFDWLER